jgi:LysM domain
MTQVADPVSASDPPSPDRRHDICPLLLAEGGWRSATPAREHRCLALGEDAPLALDKQKRLCLAPAHRTCATYIAALGLGAGSPAAATPPMRPYPRMAPVVLDHGRLGVTVPIAARNRPGGQFLLAALMVVAFGAIAVTRLTGVGGGGLGAGAGSPSPQATVGAANPTPATQTPMPSPMPSPSPSPVVSPAPTPPPAPGRTYKVKRGDTLSGIAARFDTSVKALVDLNEIENPSRISIGAVLKIPPENP